MNRFIASLFLSFFLIAILSLPVFSQNSRSIQHVANFSQMNIEKDFPGEWKIFLFNRVKNPTDFRLKKEKDKVFVKAIAENAAASLVKNLDLDPYEFPIMEWEWKAEKLLEGTNFEVRAQDDAPLRVMIGFEAYGEKKSLVDRLKDSSAKLITGYKFSTKILNYVWDANHEVEKVYHCTISDMIKVIPIRNSTNELGQWVSERRNILEDFEKAFGLKPKKIVAIGVMTDTDATQQTATGYYGDIFLKQNEEVE